jgi:hypothetical protein
MGSIARGPLWAATSPYPLGGRRSWPPDTSYVRSSLATATQPLAPAELGTIGASCAHVFIARQPLTIPVLLLVAAIGQTLSATVPDAADDSIRQFLAQDGAQPSYRAVRRLEAENGSRTGWLEALTEYSQETGFRYEVTTEGGSSYIRSKVLRAVLDGEQEVIAQGEAARSALARANYTFQTNGVDAKGLANILLSPRRKERVLVSGMMFLQRDGGLVRLEGRLAKSPSFWVKHVDIVRSYERINGATVPVTLESNAELRMLGAATLRMTYTYSEIDGHPIGPAASRVGG